MGYYTNYSIDYWHIDETEITEKEDIKILDSFYDITGWNYENKNITEIADIIEYDSIKWYDHDEHMCELSAQFPNIVFELSGQGENYDDLWKIYYHDGKMQFCPARIIYDDINYEVLGLKE